MVFGSGTNKRIGILRAALKGVDVSYKNSNKYKNLRKLAINFIGIGTNNSIGYFNGPTTIAAKLSAVKNKRNKIAANQAERAKKNKIAANLLATLNKVNNKNLETLGLKRNAGAIRRAIRLAELGPYEEGKYTYPSLIQNLLKNMQKQNEEKKRKQNNNNAYMKNQLTKLTPAQLAIFEALRNGSKNKYPTIPGAYFTNMPYGPGTYAHQTDPLKGRNLLNFRIKIAKELALKLKSP